MVCREAAQRGVRHVDREAVVCFVFGHCSLLAVLEKLETKICTLPFVMMLVQSLHRVDAGERLIEGRALLLELGRLPSVLPGVLVGHERRAFLRILVLCRRIEQT